MPNGEERTRSGNVVHPVAVTAAVGVLGWLVLATAALLLGWLVSHVVVGSTLGHGDADVARWFADRRTEGWNTASLVGSWFAETVTVFIVVAIALVALAIKRAWPQFGLLVVAMCAEGATYVVCTYVISRNRPAVPRLEDLINSDSYPSGHTAAAMALYGSICVIVWSLTRSRAWRTVSMLLAVLAPLIVATSRVYRGMHNVTDVCSGMLIGAGCILVGYVAVRAGSAAAQHARPDVDSERSSASGAAASSLHQGVLA
jgi:undecaprenyl-diphosphatase